MLFIVPLRVSTHRTGRPRRRATAATTTSSGEQPILAPKPPPPPGAMRCTAPGSRPRAAPAAPRAPAPPPRARGQAADLGAEAAADVGGDEVHGPRVEAERGLDR